MHSNTPGLTAQYHASKLLYSVLSVDKKQFNLKSIDNCSETFVLVHTKIYL